MQFWDDSVEILRELAGALVPGGVLASTYQPRKPGAVAADTDAMAARLAEFMNEAGFDDVRVEWLDLKPVPAVCVLGRRIG